MLTIDGPSRTLKNVIDMGSVDKAQLAENIRTGRARLNMTRVQFAKAAGLSTNTLRALEMGTHARVPDLPTIEKVAKLLKTTADRLITGKVPIVEGDPLLTGLSREDLTIARAFHDAILDAKNAVRTLLKGPYTEEMRERLAVLILRLVRLDDAALAAIDELLAAIDVEQATSPPRALQRPVAAVPPKHRAK